MQISKTFIYTQASESLTVWPSSWHCKECNTGTSINQRHFLHALLCILGEELKCTCIMTIESRLHACGCTLFSIPWDILSGHCLTHVLPYLFSSGFVQFLMCLCLCRDTDNCFTVHVHVHVHVHVYVYIYIHYSKEAYLPFEPCKLWIP